MSSPPDFQVTIYDAEHIATFNDDLLAASGSRTGFWDNPEDDADWAHRPLSKAPETCEVALRKKLPQTLKEVDLPARIRAAGGLNLKEAGEFFGWEAAKLTKTVTDFDKNELLAKGWTKERLLDVAEGYNHIARITPNNPSAAGPARQLREIAKLLD